jgi:hypothetical protein
VDELQVRGDVMRPRGFLSSRPRIWVAGFCATVVLAIGVRSGLTYDHDRLLRVFEGLFFTGLSCLVIVLAMVFVRKVFEATAVRMLFDVLVFLIWLMILWANSDVIVKGSAALSMEGQQAVMLTLPFTVVFTVGAVVVAWAVALFLALRTHFRNAHKDQHLSDEPPPR